MKSLKARTHRNATEHREPDDNTVPRFLFRYRAFRDSFDSLKKILLYNLWYLGSRKDFDDQEDMVLPGVVLVPEHLRNLAIEKYGHLTKDVESQIEQYLKDPLAEKRTTAAIQKDLDEVGILCLSEQPDNRRLWEAYADDGKGVCLNVAIVRDFSRWISRPHLWTVRC